jgi:S-adenosylmethionine:tRNA ribosyltransferase-isomerase
MSRFFTASLPRQIFGYKRSDAKLMVVEGNIIMNSYLQSLPDLLEEGDLLIFNNSKIVPSSLQVYSQDLQEYLTVNIGTDRISNLFTLEIRPRGTGFRMREGSRLDLLDSSGSIVIFKRHQFFPRYWWGELEGDNKIESVLHKYGKFIRYDHIPFEIPEVYYEGQFYKIPGSVELPSASYAFDSHLVKELVDRGISLEELTLHCNLGSLEPNEFLGKGRLMEERYSIPFRTIRSIFETRRRGNKIIAVGTTVVRALETLVEVTVGTYSLRKVTEEYSDGAFSGTTSMFINGNHRLRMVDGIITGMHEEDGSHIMMLEAFQGKETLKRMSEYANEWGYMYHEFGDLSLIFRNRK